MSPLVCVLVVGSSNAVCMQQQYSSQKLHSMQKKVKKVYVVQSICVFWRVYNSSADGGSSSVCMQYWELNVCVRDIMLAVCVLVILYECVCVMVRACYVETPQLIFIDYLGRYVWYGSAQPGHGGQECRVLEDQDSFW